MLIVQNKGATDLPLILGLFEKRNTQKEKWLSTNQSEYLLDKCLYKFLTSNSNSIQINLNTIKPEMPKKRKKEKS